MRLAISGTHSTGKTTLLKALQQTEQFKNFLFLESITRVLKEFQLQINQAGNDVSQSFILADHWRRSTLPNNVFLDRCILDGLVYTEYLFNKSLVSSGVHQLAIAFFEKLLPAYDIIFYLRPEFKLVDDGVRDTDQQFQTAILELFEEKIQTYAIPVALIQGTLEERVTQILEYCF